MATFKDISVDDDDGDLLFSPITGDFVISPSNMEDIDNILLSFLGAYKEFPLVGVGLQAYQSGSGVQPVLKTVINTQLVADGFTDVTVVFDKTNPDNINVNAIRNQ